MTSLEKIEKNFHKLIKKFISKKALADGSYEFPSLTDESSSGYTAVPGMYGGFKYCMKMDGEKPVLYVHAASRMDLDEEFLIDEDSFRRI